ncbi:MAG: SDR family NAD(P)-dependent oxidoreductase [Pseudomonadota bacterium]
MLQGKRILVTGASRGIGFGAARALAATGAHLMLTARTVSPSDPERDGGLGARLGGSLEEARELLTELAEKSGGSLLIHPCDLKSGDEVEALVAHAENQLGGIDLLLANGQFSGSIDGRFWETPLSAWDDQMDITPRAYYALARAAVPGMIARRGGLILNVSSPGAVLDFYSVAYSVGRAGIDRMTQSMATQLEGTGVTIMTLWPAYLKTERVIAAVQGEDVGIPTMPDFDLEARASTPDIVGVAAAHLLADKDVSRFAGKMLTVAEIGQIYGFRDVDGTAISTAGLLTELEQPDGTLAVPVYDRRGLFKT